MTGSYFQNSLSRGFTGTQLKCIALGLMVLDHIYEFFRFACAPVWLHWLGRLSAPLFLFCAAEGFAYTRNRRVYTVRIYLVSTGMALLSWLMASFGLFCRIDGFYPQNGIFQCFFWLCVQWQGIDWLKSSQKAKGTVFFLLPLLWTAAEPALGLAGGSETLLTAFLPTVVSMPEGGAFFLTEGILLYALRENRKRQVAVWACAVLFMHFIWYALKGYPVYYLLFGYAQWMAAFAGAFMLLYNGRRGKGMKALFYLFYPAHIYALFALSCLYMYFLL